MCGRTKTEVFGYDDFVDHMLLVLRFLCGGCYRISIVLALSCGRAKTIQICFVCTSISSSSSSFLEAEKNNNKKIYPGTCGRGLNSFLFFSSGKAVL